MKTIKKIFFNSKLLKKLYSSILCAYRLVYDGYFKDNYFLIINLGIHFFVAFIIGGLELVNLDIMQKAIGLFIFSFLILLNFQFFLCYNKEKIKLILKNKNKNKNSPSRLTDTVFQGKTNIFIPWILSNLKFSILIFVIGFFYNKGIIPGIVYLLNLDPDFQLAFLFILLIVTPQVGIILYFLNSGGLLAKFYFFCYLIILRWILIILILLFVPGYDLEFSRCLFLLLSTGMFSIFLEIDLFMEVNVIFKALFSEIINYFIHYIEIIIDNYGKLICSYSNGALPSYKLIKFGHNSKIPFYLKKEVIDSLINLKVKTQSLNNIVRGQAINNIVPVTTRYVPSIIDFNTKKIIISCIILEVINCNKKFCSYKLLGGASSSNSNFNSLIFPSESLLLGNQTFSQYLQYCRDAGIMSNKFTDLFFDPQYKSFNKYKDSIIDSKHKFILSIFVPLFTEPTNFFCFGVNRKGHLVAIPFDKVFFNDKPNLSVYKLINTYDNEGDMIRESNLYINEKNADHWVGGLSNHKTSKTWYSYSYVNEIKVPTIFEEGLCPDLKIKMADGSSKMYNPASMPSHQNRSLFLLIDGNLHKLPFKSPEYFTVASYYHFTKWKHADSINSFFRTSESLRELK